MNPPKIGSLWPEQGGIFAGMMRGIDGPDYYLVCAPAESEMEGVNWNYAIHHATLPCNGHFDWSLPDCRELRLLHINTPETFNTEGWYWSSTQDATDPDYAWGQDFVNGNQFSNRQSYEGRARVVCRVMIEGEK